MTLQYACTNHKHDKLYMTFMHVQIISMTNYMTLCMYNVMLTYRTRSEHQNHYQLLLYIGIGFVPLHSTACLSPSAHCTDPPPGGWGSGYRSVNQ